MDAVLEEAKTGTTEEARKDAYKRQQELALEEMPIVPLVNSLLLIAHSDTLMNYKPMRTGFLKTLKDAWFSA
jgi:peptide/nickel transport system substrate-binding protein